MNLNVKVDKQSLANQIVATVEQVQEPVEHSMATEFETCVRANFGYMGFERPNWWPELSNKSEIGRAYIRKVGRTYATLELTGAMKSQLRTEGGEVKLSDDKVPYALDHETGVPWKNLPQRSVFPIQNGECMPRTLSLVTDAAQNELNHLIK